MESRVYQDIEKQKLLEDGDRLLVGVSGGVDSMALLHWLWQHQHIWNLKLIAVHFNHQFRGKEADLDEAFVEERCARWKIPFRSKREDVSLYASSQHVSKQAAARECRYRFFEGVIQETGYRKLALAHHADDQIETVMMRFVRGAGLQGLSGIPCRREAGNYTIIRPFLAIDKHSLMTYCRQKKIKWREDQSNFCDDQTRNYIRQHIVPSLLTLNPNLHQVVHESTALIREENQYMDAQAREYSRQVLDFQNDSGIGIDLSSFEQVPTPLQRRVILILLSYLRPQAGNWQKKHIDYVLGLTGPSTGFKQIHLPEAIVAQREYHSLFLFDRDERQRVGIGDYEHVLPLEGEYLGLTPFLQVRITRERLTGLQAKSSQATEEAIKPTPQPMGRRIDEAVFDEDELSLPLHIRNRRPGDRMQPLGMQGHQKLKKMFIDQKITPEQREKWPIITDREHIIWVPGVKRSAHAPVTPSTRQVLRIQMIQNEGAP